MTFNPVEIIQKKKNKEAHSKDELNFMVHSYVEGTLPDYQMSAWLMAICAYGMDSSEAYELTQIFRDSGQHLKFPEGSVDKHSTGGVGDKLSLIVAPIVAACGSLVPMIAGRGLGHTGGTIDKLESLEGWKGSLSVKEFEALVLKNRAAIIQQTKDICPADQKIYALRDVTATVASYPLICASILSKKSAEGISSLVLDIKYGSGAFMDSFEKATELGKKMKTIGDRMGLKLCALITDMNEPLGKFTGNALEVKEALDILQNKKAFEKRP